MRSMFNNMMIYGSKKLDFLISLVKTSNALTEKANTEVEDKYSLEIWLLSTENVVFLYKTSLTESN